ncbi:MAG: hypothetical protein JWO97_3980 [Acidobacteria bacterium]|nr:hypothetical protein [Acidobacteriota bacterium]
MTTSERHIKDLEASKIFAAINHSTKTIGALLQL